MQAHSYRMVDARFDAQINNMTQAKEKVKAKLINSSSISLAERQKMERELVAYRRALKQLVVQKVALLARRENAGLFVFVFVLFCFFWAVFFSFFVCFCFLF